MNPHHDIQRNATTGAEYIRLFVICAAAIGLACFVLFFVERTI